MHVWEKKEKADKALELLERYGSILLKKHHRDKKRKMLKEVKKFALELLK